MENMNHSFHTVTRQELEQSGAYTVVKMQELPDINMTGFLLRHNKTGARIVLLPCSDANKVFYIGFRTPPKDSTGVAHIIEHTVLCGSRDFPVRDPFLEVVKGSMNTFLNAMTYPDKTVYPVASTNEKDFENLVHIYLDAVFHPNIYREQNIFRQEGWHFEALPHTQGGDDIDKDSEITINGVVYNEMKGAMSSVDDILNDRVLQSLYPHTTYANVSGGDPEHIPDLTYEDYLNFHRTYYHPSNSYLYFYGDMDMVSMLDWLDRTYLSEYDKKDVDSEIRTEPAFPGARRASFPYAITEEQDEKEMACLSYNVSVPIRDEKENLAFKVLDYTLCDAEGAPIREALRKNGIGKDVSSLYESGIRQPYYSITARQADQDEEQLFVSLIDDTLKDLIQNGIDKRGLEAGLNYYEFHYREADFGSYPKGLIYGLDLLDDWLYDDGNVFLCLDDGKYFEELKGLLDTGYFEALAKRCILENPHKAIVTLIPEKGLQTRQSEALKKKMEAFRQSLSEKERQKIADETTALKTWQQTPDTKEALDTIPVLSREDLGKMPLLPKNTVLSLKGAEETAPVSRPFVLSHPVFTSGIDYVTFQFDITKVPERLFPMVPVLRTLLGALDTRQYGYAALDQEITITTGGIVPNTSLFVNAKKQDGYTITFDLSMKVLDGSLEKGTALALEMIQNTDFSDQARIIEVLEEEVSGMGLSLQESGHGTAAGRARSACDVSAKIQDNLVGIGAYRGMRRILKSIRNADGFAAFQKDIRELSQFVFQKNHLLIDFTAPEETVRRQLPVLDRFCEALGNAGKKERDWDLAPYHPALTDANEGFVTAGQVQFVGCAGNFARHGYAFSGAMDVLRVIMGYDYLWNRIRVLGGAYGCMSSFGRSGGAFFVTYRDPHIRNSLQVFADAADYLTNYDADERSMTKSVIGAVSSLDRPLVPRQFGRMSLQAFLSGITDEDLQRERDEVLSCTAEDIRALAGPVRAFVSDSCICVVGSRDKILENQDLFDRVDTLEGDGETP